MELKKAYDQLHRKTRELREDLNKHVEEFCMDLDTEKGFVDGDEETVVALHKHMDSFFEKKTIPLLAFFAVLLRKVLKGVQAKFGGDFKDIQRIERALGIRGGKIVKFSDEQMTVLYGVGLMKVLENDLVLMLNNSFTGEVKRRDLANNMQRVVSRKYHDFFQTYLLSALTQSYNAAQLIYARQQGYDKFLYVGGLVDDSREFCIERAGHEFTYDQGKSWDDMWWKGKIEGVPFFVQVGGYGCGHYLEWIKDSGEEQR